MHKLLYFIIITINLVIPVFSQAFVQHCYETMSLNTPLTLFRLKTNTGHVLQLKSSVSHFCNLKMSGNPADLSFVISVAKLFLDF